MKTATPKAHAFRIAARAAILAFCMIGPLAGLAAAKDANARDISGAGFVLYVSLMRNA